MRSDAIIYRGGSFAGLFAAMYIARARRSVCVVDTGSPRNRFAAHSHGFFAQDGSQPGTMLATARSQVAAYPTVSFIAEEAVSAARKAGEYDVAGLAPSSSTQGTTLRAAAAAIVAPACVLLARVDHLRQKLLPSNDFRVKIIRDPQMNPQVQLPSMLRRGDI